MSVPVDVAEFSALRADCIALASTPRRTISPSNPVWIFDAVKFGSDLCQELLAQHFQVSGFIETQPLTSQNPSLPEYGWQQLDDSDHVLKLDAINLATLQKNLQNHNISVHCLPLALSDGYQMLSFNAGNSDAGTISTIGTVHIAAMGLVDLLCNQSTDFIKLDVEGGKIATLNGAARLITRCRPVQAVSFYSRQQVLWEIPQLMLVMCHDYQLFLCQHYYNTFDSVLCAVPH